MKNTGIVSLLVISLSGFTVTGCNQEASTPEVNLAVSTKYQQNTTLDGRVSNNDGIIKSGLVKAMDTNEKVIAQATVDNGYYRIEIPAGTALPILLTFSSESTTDPLVSAVIYETITKYYINPSSTAIAKAAKAMGGYNRANMVRAAQNTVSTPDDNKTSAGWRGDPTTQYGGWH